MKIKRGGFVCQVAYFWRKDWQVPDQTNLCNLFWRFILNLIPVSIIYLFVTCIALVILAFASLVGFLFAKRPGFDSNNKKMEMVDFKHWPVVKGRRIYPIYILAFALVWLLRHYIVGGGGLILTALGSTMFWAFIGILLAIILLVILIIFLKIGVKKMIASETGQLCIGMIRAKKQRFCPIVEIVTGEDDGGEEGLATY